MNDRPAAWTATYPAMRSILDTVIRANRSAKTPVVDIRYLERVRLELGQLDRGTYRSCTRGEPAWCASSAFCLVRGVAAVTSLGHPATGAIYRLAAELADETARIDRLRAQQPAIA